MNTDASKLTQYTREAKEMQEAAEWAMASGEFAYAVAAATEHNNRCPITKLADCQDRHCELHYMDAPLKLA